MKSTLNAIETTLPGGIEPVAVASSGHLRAIVCDSQEGLHFVIGREDPDTGQLEPVWFPSDIENLARLTAMVAHACHALLDGQLSEDLGCLAHCLSQTLGLEFNEKGRPQTSRRQ